MIDKIKGKYRLICDICGEAADEVFNTFDEAVDYKVDSEWISRKQDGEWADICPNCYSIKDGKEAIKRPDTGAVMVWDMV